MTGGSPYATPSAFRQALTDKLTGLAGAGKWSLPDLQRQVAYDRLLERLYVTDDGWIIKGAAALIARDLAVRGTNDLDLYRETEREQAEHDLRRAASLDLKDWFQFEIESAGAVGGAAAAGVRLLVTAYVGNTVWVRFHADIVGNQVRMTAEPEPVSALVRQIMPDFEQHGYRAYPLVDHIADKVAAILERHGGAARPSTRYKDLIDLVAIVRGARVPAKEQLEALVHEAARRNLTLPTTFSAPDRTLWQAGYAREAARSLLPVAHTLDQALEVVRPFIDPLLRHQALGKWDPARGVWVRAHTSDPPRRP